jgi:hypothetical protein
MRHTRGHELLATQCGPLFAYCKNGPINAGSKKRRGGRRGRHSEKFQTTKIAAAESSRSGSLNNDDFSAGLFQTHGRQGLKDKSPPRDKEMGKNLPLSLSNRMKLCQIQEIRNESRNKSVCHKCPTQIQVGINRVSKQSIQVFIFLSKQLGVTFAKMHLDQLADQIFLGVRLQDLTASFGEFFNLAGLKQAQEPSRSIFV